jgi:hypothetical protein
MTQPSSISRRQILNLAKSAAGASIAGVTMTDLASAQGLTQKAAHYQDTPHGAQRCDTCSNWLPPFACKVLDGHVVASGWCTAWVKGPKAL